MDHADDRPPDVDKLREYQAQLEITYEDKAAAAQSTRDHLELVKYCEDNYDRFTKALWQCMQHGGDPEAITLCTASAKQWRKRRRDHAAEAGN